MNRAWIFIDEQGDIKFGQQNTAYFSIAAVVTLDPVKLVAGFETLRHDLWAQRHLIRGAFHATAECRDVRRAVFALFPHLPLLRCDVVAIKKASVYENHRSPPRLYRAVLRVLMRYLVPRLPTTTDELVVVAAEWQPMVRDLTPILRDVLTVSGARHPLLWSKGLTVLQAPCSTHPGLQLADHVAWAAHRRRTKDETYWWEKVKAPGRGVSDFIVGS